MTKTVLLTILVAGLAFSSIGSAGQPLQELAIGESSDSEDKERIILRGVVLQGDPECRPGEECLVLLSVRHNARWGRYDQTLQRGQYELEGIAPGIKERDAVQVYGEVSTHRSKASPLIVTIVPSQNFCIKKV